MEDLFFVYMRFTEEKTVVYFTDYVLSIDSLTP
jgi:hypothetical protein